MIILLFQGKKGVNIATERGYKIAVILMGSLIFFFNCASQQSKTKRNPEYKTTLRVDNRNFEGMRIYILSSPRRVVKRKIFLSIGNRVIHN